MDELKIEVAEALVLKPGDRVLLLARDGWTMQMFDQAQTALRDGFPEVEFTFINRIESAVLQPAPVAALEDQPSSGEG